MKCDRPPIGWECTREPGHEGPCAAYPIDEIETIGRWAKRLGAPQFYVLRTIIAAWQGIAIGLVLLRTFRII